MAIKVGAPLYYVDTEAERDLAWGEGALIFCEDVQKLYVISNGAFSGMEDSSIPAWTKYTVDHSDFTAASTSEAITLASLPAGTVVHAVLQKTSTAFSGGSVSAFKTSVGVEDAVYDALMASCTEHWPLLEAGGTTRVGVQGVVNMTDSGTVGQMLGPNRRTYAARFASASSRFLYAASDAAALKAGDVDLFIEFWVMLSKLNAAKILVAKYKHDTNQKSWLFSYDQPTDRFAFVVSNDGSADVVLYANSYGTPPPGQWIHVCGWHDAVGNTINLQVEGGPVDSSAHATGLFDCSEPISIGSDRPSSGGRLYHDGGIQDVRIFNGYIPTAAERAYLFNDGFGRESGAARYGRPYDAFAAVGAYQLDRTDFRSGVGLDSMSGAVDLKLFGVATGDNVANLSAGEIDIYVLTSQPTAAA